MNRCPEHPGRPGLLRQPRGRRGDDRGADVRRQRRRDDARLARRPRYLGRPRRLPPTRAGPTAARLDPVHLWDHRTTEGRRLDGCQLRVGRPGRRRPPATDRRRRQPRPPTAVPHQRAFVLVPVNAVGGGDGGAPATVLGVPVLGRRGPQPLHLDGGGLVLRPGAGRVGGATRAHVPGMGQQLQHRAGGGAGWRRRDGLVRHDRDGVSPCLRRPAGERTSGKHGAAGAGVSSVVAFVLSDGDAVDVATRVNAMCAERLPTFKRPVEVRVVCELPRSTLDKVAKAELRRMATR